jgi:hypothetical protein
LGKISASACETQVLIEASDLTEAVDMSAARPARNLAAWKS